jgi:hypothetical protein
LSVKTQSSLEEQPAAGAAAAWFPALTTMAGLQANWEFLHEFRARNTRVIDELRERSAHRLQEMEAKYLLE